MHIKGVVAVTMNSSEEGETGEGERHIDCPFLGRGSFRVIHQVWEGGSEEERQEDQEEENDEDGAPKCSTQTSSKVGMTLRQPMSNIMSEDSESLSDLPIPACSLSTKSGEQSADHER